MELLPSSQRLKLLEYITRLKYQLAEWLIVEIKLIKPGQNDIAGPAVAEVLKGLFATCDGFVLACNMSEVLMLIRWGSANTPQKLVKEVRAQLPAEHFEVNVAPPTREGLIKITLSLAPPLPDDGPFHASRVARAENVILIADDDMYMRSLARAGLKGAGNIIEVVEGGQVVDAYKTHNPDLLLLDIHLPGLSGQEILGQIRAFDPKAYIVMLSADSSVENVKFAQTHGAKGFLAKPLHKEKLLEYVRACPTIM